MVARAQGPQGTPGHQVVPGPGVPPARPTHLDRDPLKRRYQERWTETRGMSPSAEAARSTLASLRGREKIHERFEFLIRARSGKDRHRRWIGSQVCSTPESTP